MTELLNKTKEQENFKKIKNIKLIDRLDYTNQNTFKIDVKNPTRKLQFQSYKQNYVPETVEYKNTIVFAVVVVLLLISAVFNNTFSRNLDINLVNFFATCKNFLVDNTTAPYVVTIGEYGNFAIAKEEAKDLLPKLRQLDIKEISPGVYTFEISRFNSKKKAYKLAKELIRDDVSSVHVRYLPN